MWLLIPRCRCDIKSESNTGLFHYIHSIFILIIGRFFDAERNNFKPSLILT